MAGGGNDNQPIVTRFDPADRGGEEGGNIRSLSIATRLTDSAFARKLLVPQSFHRGLEPANLFMVLSRYRSCSVAAGNCQWPRQAARPRNHASHRRYL
jgi:hypothetical protein